MSRTRHDLLRPSTALLALAALATLAGCADAGTPGNAVTGPDPAPGTSATAAPDASGASGASTTPQVVAPAEGGATTSTAADRCRSRDLDLALVGEQGSPAGAAEGLDDEEVTLVLTNTGDATCTLQGWPGVSFVGGGDGTQLGAAADRDIVSLPHDRVTLRPGGGATVPVAVASAADWSDRQCVPQDADGLRVYPPGETHALFVEGDFTACTDPAVPLLTVHAVQPG